MSALNIAQSNSLQDQKQRETLRSHYSAKAPASEPLAAPTPTRAPVAPPAASLGMWTPDVGIKFGGTMPPQPVVSGNVHNPAYPNTRSGTVQGGQWHPGQGVRFG